MAGEFYGNFQYSIMDGQKQKVEELQTAKNSSGDASPPFMEDLGGSKSPFKRDGMFGIFETGSVG